MVIGKNCAERDTLQWLPYERRESRLACANDRLAAIRRLGRACRPWGARRHLMRRVWIALALLAGIVFGMGAFTFVYARGHSYLTNDPAACANCHIMSEHYAAWTKSPHRAVAACNDCHTPHGQLRKYSTKARNGFWHSFCFTDLQFPGSIANHAAQPHDRRGVMPLLPRASDRDH